MENYQSRMLSKVLLPQDPTVPLNYPFLFEAFFRVTLSPVLILFTAARLEEDFQTDKWGLVQGGHDLDRADLAVKVSSGALFWRLLSQP